MRSVYVYFTNMPAEWRKYSCNMAMKLCSPLQRLSRLSVELGVDLWVKRDDLTPIPGGGTKIRKLQRILREAPQDVNALVTTGGVQSNHARVVALVAASRGMRCDLVLHGDPRELQRPTGNLLLMLLAGANIRVVEPDLIRPELERVLLELKENGWHPLLIEGGGHSVSASLALVDAVHELLVQRPDISWVPDFIVHASGTGGTQAGILAGLDSLGWSSRVVGISVARSAVRGRVVIEELYEQVRHELQLQGVKRDIDFRDEWVGSGYGKPLAGIERLIKHVASLEGLPLDPTYTAKAMQGLIDLIRMGDISKGSRVLFWHTGGLLNLMSSDLGWGPEE